MWAQALILLLIGAAASGLTLSVIAGLKERLANRNPPLDTKNTQ